jgi:hypothetical protein
MVPSDVEVKSPRAENLAFAKCFHLSRRRLVCKVRIMEAQSSTLDDGIRVLHQLGRNGGTVISQCLATMKNCVLLSEIHPHSAGMYDGTHEPLWQAHTWFGLFNRMEYDHLSQCQLSFAESIKLIHDRARQRRFNLVLRDWSYLDFLSHPLVSESNYKFSIVQALPTDVPVARAALIRHPLQQYCSMMKLAIVRDALSVDRYAHGCRRFAEQSQGMPRFRYEDFCIEPVSFLKQLCSCLHLPFEEVFANRWMSYQSITGCVETRRFPRPIGTRVLHPVQREVREQFEQNCDYQAAVELLGYGHDGHTFD